MSAICPHSGAVCQSGDSPPARPAPSRSEGRQGLRPPRPGRTPRAGVLKTLAASTAVLAGFCFVLWLLLTRPFLTVLGGFVLLIVVSIATDTGNSPYSGTTPSPSAPVIPRKRELEAQVARERERVDAAVGGLILGLALGYWFFDD